MPKPLMPEKPMVKTLIITGSSGLIGSSLIHRVGEDYREIGLDREGPPNPPPHTEQVIDCDLSSDESVRAAFHEVSQLGCERIASVIHLAAYDSFSTETRPSTTKSPCVAPSGCCMSCASSKSNSSTSNGRAHYYEREAEDYAHEPGDSRSQARFRLRELYDALPIPGRFWVVT